MRSLFKVVRTSLPEAMYWFETRPAAGTEPVPGEALRPESGFDVRRASCS